MDYLFIFWKTYVACTNDSLLEATLRAAGNVNIES